MNLVIGLLVPFLGTSLGAACVFFMKNGLNRLVQKALLGFASGVMVAASVWSLLIPSIDIPTASATSDNVRGNGKICIFTGSNRIYIWNPVFTADGQNHSASSYE